MLNKNDKYQYTNWYNQTVTVTVDYVNKNQAYYRAEVEGKLVDSGLTDAQELEKALNQCQRISQ
jgi:serine protease inhibitor